MSVHLKNLQPVLGPTPSDLVAENHPYRRLLEIVPFDELCSPLRSKYSQLGRGGYPVESIFKALILQWMEDLSYRELERFLQENLAAKLFCGFGLQDTTPDYSTFCTAMKRIGAQGAADLFNRFRQSLKDAELIHEVFTFVDATHLISKVNLWHERDKTIKAGYDKLENETISQFTTDTQARMGKKGKLKWFGYKIHASVDMTHGLICKVAVTAANVEDTRAVRHILPESGMVFGDKAFGVGDSAKAMRGKGLHSGAILKNDMKAKNHDKDRWLTSVRMPYEGMWSKFQPRARYRGTAKCQYQAFMEAFRHNFKRLIAIEAAPLVLRPHYA